MKINVGKWLKMPVLEKKKLIVAAVENNKR